MNLVEMDHRLGSSRHFTEMVKFSYYTKANE